MTTIKISLTDNDYVVQANTKMEFNDKQNLLFSNFIDQIKEELDTGQSAFLEIEGLKGDPVKFEITQSA